MKTLNMQITLSTYQQLSDNGELNPPFISKVLSNAYMSYSDNNIGKELKQPTAKYALKIDDVVHYEFKRSALENSITLSELSGRLFEKYYQLYKDVK